MIFDASTSFASTCRSAGDSVERSAVMSVGANRAAIACSFTRIGHGRLFSRGHSRPQAHPRRAAQADDDRFHDGDLLTKRKLRVPMSVHAARHLERGRIRAETPDRRLPHPVGRRVEDQLAIDVAHQPRRRFELGFELPGPQPE